VGEDVLVCMCKHQRPVDTDGDLYNDVGESKLKDDRWIRVRVNDRGTYENNLDIWTSKGHKKFEARPTQQQQYTAPQVTKIRRNLQNRPETSPRYMLDLVSLRNRLWGG